MSDSDQNNTQDQTSQDGKTRQCLKKGHICCLIIFDIIIIIVNVLVLAFAHFCHGNLWFDCSGATIGILSILVMVLVTWNIYTVIDVKDVLKEINSYRGEMDEIKNTQEANSNKISQLHSHIETTNTKIEKMDTELNRLCDEDLLNSQMYFEWLCLSLNRIAIYCKIGQSEFAKDEAQIIIDDFNKEEQRKLTPYQWNTIIRIFEEKEICEVLPNYKELRLCLHKIKEIGRGLYGTITKKQQER